MTISERLQALYEKLPAKEQDDLDAILGNLDAACAKPNEIVNPKKPTTVQYAEALWGLVDALVPRI
jgi:hypothetical protein